MNVRVDEEPKGARRDAIINLLARAEAVDGDPPLPDPQQHAVVAGEAGVRLLLAQLDGHLAAFGVLSASDDGVVLHLVLDPAHRSSSAADALSDELIHTALGLDEAPIRIWAMRATEGDDALARRHGFEPERSLVQMRVPLPLQPEVVAGTPPLRTRPFRPGHDEGPWLDVNNRAFAGHPEQGNWSMAELQGRLRADWFDANGFLVAEAEDGTGLIGSCWTKVHRMARPPLGEIYIISVDPNRHGQGWGKALTVAGLAWLGEQGITIGMLYTDDDNVAALALYRSLGFTVDHVDRSYLRRSSSTNV